MKKEIVAFVNANDGTVYIGLDEFGDKVRMDGNES